MARHVPPHRWADAASGALTPVQLAVMEEHADACPRCAGARDRVRAAQRGFREIRDDQPPRLNWEHIGARIYWVTSSERRAAVRERKPRGERSRWMYAGVAAAGLAFGLAVLLVWPDPAPPPSRATVDPGASSTEAAALPAPLEVELITEPAAGPVRGLITYRRGDVRVGGGALGFDRVIGAGDVLTTGSDGHVTLQFGTDSGLTLAPGSSLELRALDSRAVELVLSGDVTVDVERRPAGQRFEVEAGDHVVAVRGTAFQVRHRDGALAVACARGKVEVRGPETRREIGAGQLLELAAGERLSQRAPGDLSAALAEVLERDVRVRLLPVWNGTDEVAAASSVLALAAHGDAPVDVDGERVGSGSFELRVISGRHHVDVGDGGRWVRTAAGETLDTITAAPPAAPRDDARARRADLDRALGNGARARRCLRSLEKQGLLAGSFIELDVGVNRDGSLGHLNIRRTNVPSDDAACVRSVVDGVRLPRGERATLRYRIAY